jgi:hypothetical protein
MRTSSQCRGWRRGEDASPLPAPAGNHSRAPGVKKKSLARRSIAQIGLTT